MASFESIINSNYNALPTDALIALISGFNAGIAIFDSDLKLTFANPQYVELFGYSLDETKPGTSLSDLARISMVRAGFEPYVIDDQIERGIERLKVAGGFSFRFTTPSGSGLYVHRQLLPWPCPHPTNRHRPYHHNNDTIPP